MTSTDDSPAVDPAVSDPPLAGSPCLAGDRVAFTGTLASMTHRQAMEVVTTNGGSASGHVSAQTTMLVVGEEGWPLENNGQPSVKLQEVTERQQQGQPIRVIRESEFLHLVGLDEQRREVHRQYTPAMLSQLLGVSVHVIRRWARAGLIRPVRRVCRLPYFDFQEVAGARRLSDLLAQGVPRREIERSLGKLTSVLDGVERPLAQLELLASGTRVVCRDPHGFLEPASGQRLLDFELDAVSPRTNDDDEQALPLVMQAPDEQLDRSGREWFDRGRQLLDDGEPESAIEAFRMGLMERPGDPEVNFHLAEALYRAGNRDGALERYYAAVERDHNYIEAWTQLGCLHAERDEPDAALEAFDLALDAHPDFPDAHLHKGEVLHRLDRTDEAVPHWKRYLEFDSRGPWAESARQRLLDAGVDLPVESTVGVD